MAQQSSGHAKNHSPWRPLPIFLSCTWHVQLIDAPLPRPPVEIGVSPHWLFINGVQPTTAENAPLSRPTAKRAKTATGRPAVAGKASAAAAVKAEPGAAGGEVGGARASAVQVQPPVQHILSKETQIYFAKVVDIIKAAADAAGEMRGGCTGVQNQEDVTGSYPSCFEILLYTPRVLRVRVRVEIIAKLSMASNMRITPRTQLSPR